MSLIIRIFVVFHEDVDFSCPIITKLRDFVVTLRMATLYKILILCVGFALSNNLWAQSRLTNCEKQTELDSIIAEVEKALGLNDEAYSAKIAKDKWLSGEANFLLQGGIAPVAYIGQEKFKEKFGVDYEDFGCITHCSKSQMEEYNTVIMDYLTAKFGNEWLKHIRKDVPGLSKYGNDAFKKISYDNSGIAILTIPVIYKSMGKSAGFDSKDSTFVEKIGSEPTTSLELLYRGKEYYIPVSCNTDMENTLSILWHMENELIEITIKLFDPKLFLYSKSLRPYPFGIIENINLLR